MSRPNESRILSESLVIPPSVELSSEYCLQRQAKLLDRLSKNGIESVLILDRRHVHYLTGFWDRSVFEPALLLRQDDVAMLALPYASSLQTATVITYEANRLGTMTDESIATGINLLLALVDSTQTLGSDVPLAGRQAVSIMPDLFAMRRSKWPDEVMLLRRAIAAAEAAYAYAVDVVRPGLNEIDLYAGLLAAATRAAGEPVGELGNDFQSGSGGGTPRNREMLAGELLVLDLGVVVRGYNADLCRAFSVDRQPTPRQTAAHQRIINVLAEVERTSRPGTSCRELYEKSFAYLEGYESASFGHHLGHGTGLSPHEAPRLNPHWDDVLQVGDVFTAEPGLYHAELRAGIRIEQMFLVTDSGVERLSHFPTGLVDA